MSIKIQLLMALTIVPITGGMIATMAWSRYRDHQRIALRLNSLVASGADHSIEQDLPSTLLKTQDRSADSSLTQLVHQMPGLNALQELLSAAALADWLVPLAMVIAVALVGPIVAAIVLNLNVFLATLIGVLAAGLCILF